jgi:hypothetical protein
MIKAVGAVLFVAAFCYGDQWNSIPSDAAKVPPQEAQRFLEIICPGHASATGCTVCPPETPLSAQTWQLRAVTFGRFLAATSEDALVSGFGCEPHSNLMSGAYLFTKEGPSWRKVWYSPGENAANCKKLYGSDGRDLLVCEASDMHQGVADSFLYLLDPGQDPGSRKDNSLDIFFDVTDSLGSCVMLPDDTTLSGKIESVSFTAASAPHAMRITVIARLGKAAVPTEILYACNQSNFKRRPIIATTLRRYQFLFDGKKVVPGHRNPPMHFAAADAPNTSYRASK